MAREIVKLVPPSKEANPKFSRLIGRVAIFTMSTGDRLQGKILAANEDWIDTDNGAVKVANIILAKWVSQEEEQIIRGGPLGSYDPYQLPRRR